MRAVRTEDEETEITEIKSMSGLGADHEFNLPTKQVKTGDDIQKWLNSQAYQVGLEDFHMRHFFVSFLKTQGPFWAKKLIGGNSSF